MAYTNQQRSREMIKPEGAQAWIDCSFYKLGRFHKPFIWIAGGWRLSSKDAMEIGVKRYFNQYAV
jgi:hypothetical protein